VPVRDLYAAQVEPLIGAIAIAWMFNTWGRTMPFVETFGFALALAYPAALLTSCLRKEGRRTTGELFGFMARQMSHVRSKFGASILARSH
jgi:hypothetical protein